MGLGNGTLPAARGRPFAKGNPGRRPGSKNKAAQVAAALLEGEAPELLSKAIALAKNGDVPMMKFLLSRTLPRERTVKLDLPRMNFADDAVEAIQHITHAVAEGTITPSEGVSLASLIDSQTRAIDIADLVKRVDAIDAKLMKEFAP
jgi:hypothetical protein